MRKNVLTAAVGAAIMGMASMASAAEPIPVDLGYVNGLKSTKFIAGNGTALNIQTNGDVPKLIEDLKTAAAQEGLSAKLNSLLAAISQTDGTHAILTGTTGGGTFIDQNTDTVLNNIYDGDNALGKFLLDVLESKSLDQLPQKLIDRTQTIDLFKDGGTSLSIGGDKSEPVLLLTVGGDRLLNADLQGMLNSGAASVGSVSLTRTGDVLIDAQSGNLFGLTGGSSAINVNHLAASFLVEIVGAKAASTSTNLVGDVTMNLDGHVNAAGVLGGGSAIALGGSAASTVDGSTTINITTSHNIDNNVSGAVVGLLGGGLAASTLDGTSTVKTTGKTTITATDGVSVGIFGGGGALSAELEGTVWNAVKGSSIGAFINLDDDDVLAEGGIASAESGDIEMAFTGDAVSVAVAGGGLAAASSGGTGGESHASVKTGNITVTLGAAGDPGFSTDQDRVDLSNFAGKFISDVSNAISGGITIDSLTGLVDPISNAISEAQKSYQGAHVGTVGGSIVVARMPSSAAGTVATAEAEHGNITLNLAGGYNVAALGGGMTIAMGEGEADGTYAKSNADSTTLNITGGDNVLVMAGGAAYATGSNGQNSKIESTSHVGDSFINVSEDLVENKNVPTRVDGIFGGGLAIDDTNASIDGNNVPATNATASTDSVTINVAGGTISQVDTSPLMKIATGVSSGAPSNGSYVHDSAELIGKDHAKAAIVGGGIATGAGAIASVGTVDMNLTGGEIDGNVYGGGAATLGGTATVGTATINVAGAKIAGDIYGGGLSGSTRNDSYENAVQYALARADVDTVNINLLSGTVEGDIHAGGYNFSETDKATTSVRKANVVIAWNEEDVFKGSEIDGEGAQTANLVLTGGDFDMTRTSGNTTISAFSTVNVAGSLKGVTYEFGDKNETVFTGGPSMIEFGGDFESSKTATIGTEEATGFVGVEEKDEPTDGLVNVVNGAFGVGTDSAAKASDAYGEVAQDAVLYLTGTVDLSKSLISVGSDATEVTGVQIGDKGILVADASGSTDVTGSITLSKNGVYFDNVGVNLAEGATEQRVTFSDDIATDAAYAWDNVLWSAEVTDLEGKTTYIFRADNALGLDDGVYSFYNDLAVDDPLRDRIDSSVYRGEENLRAGMNMAAAAGVQTAAIQGAVLGIDAASRRASLTRDYADGVVGYAEATGIYNKMGGSGDMNEMKVELGGVVVGGDYTMGDWTFGGLVNVGTGTVRGQGDNGGLKNEVDYYGFEAYAAKRFGTFNVVGHVGYTATKNDVTDSSVGYAKADDLDADVWSIGVRGEMSYAMSSACRVVPYVGINYLRVGTDGYTASNGVSVDDVDQDLFTVPVGAAFTGTIATASGWAWTPSVDIAYIGAFGDRDVDADVRSGDALGSVSMDVWSESVGRARVGLEASKGNFGVGVMAGGVFGSDDTSGVFGQIRVRYAF